MPRKFSLTSRGDFGNTNHLRSRCCSQATRGCEQAANSSTGLNLSFDVVTVKAIVTLVEDREDLRSVIAYYLKTKGYKSS
jgi:hypothetical protein